MFVVMESTRKNSTQSRISQKKTTFFLTSTEETKSPSNEPKQLHEQGNRKGKFASVAKTVLLANRAFPQTTRKASRTGSSISIPVPQESTLASSKFATTASAPSTVDDNLSLYAIEDVSQMGNTYKMEPDDGFLSQKASGIIRDVLEARLKSKTYAPEESKKLSIEISEEIKKKVKAEVLVERYKFVCVVWIGQVLGQGVHITSRCLWNARFDNFAQESFKNDQLFAQASIYAVFVE